MLHWTPNPSTDMPVTPIGALVRAAPVRGSGARADHARMMAHAATRRRAAFGSDAQYWKACAPAAIAKAASLRGGGGFARLP